MPKLPLIFLGFCCAFAATCYASDKGVEASKCLQTRMQVSQEIGNVFSRTIAFQVNGYDDFVRRVSGTGLYKVLSVAPGQIVLKGTFLYDGNPASTGENTIKDGGRTICWKGDCSLATDASGVSINPLFWGFPKGKLHVGQSWEINIAVPWELGPPGKQVVKVISVDPLNDEVTLERQGEGEGEALNEIKKLSLVKDKKTYAVDVIPGKSRWSGYTTFQRGVVISDVLMVEKPVTVSSKELGQSNGTERQYILLNQAPPALLEN